MIEVKGIIKEEDFVRAMKGQQKRVTIPLNFLIGMFAVFMLLTAVASILGPMREGIVPAVGFMAFMMLMFGICRYMIFRNIKKTGAQAASHSSPSVIHFDSESLQAVSESGTSKTEWAKFQKVVETTDDFLFFPLTNMMWPIPKSLFTDRADIIKLRGLLGDRLGRKAKLLKS